LFSASMRIFSLAMLVYDYKLLQIGRLEQFIMINKVGVKCGRVEPPEN